jgi:hypothetical protein
MRLHYDGGDLRTKATILESRATAVASCTLRFELAVAEVRMRSYEAAHGIDSQSNPQAAGCPPRSPPGLSSQAAFPISGNGYGFPQLSGI